MEKAIKVTEQFNTIQGEGPSAGLPAYFIRLTHCNLNCSWCDTYWKTGDLTSFESLLKNIKKTKAEIIVITGGEPFMQKDLHLLVDYLLKFSNLLIEIETNATLEPSIHFRYFSSNRLFFNCSPKLENSGEPLKKRRTEHLEWYAKRALRDQAIFKFVIGTKEDFNEVLELQKLYNIPNNKIYLMPLTDPNIGYTNTNCEAIVELCKEYGFRYCDRVHVRVWGGKKGV